MIKEPFKKLLIIVTFFAVFFNNACQKDNPYMTIYQVATPWVVKAAEVGAFYLFSKFFFGGYQDKINQLEEQAKVDHQIIAMIVASADGDEERTEVIRSLIHQEERESFIERAALQDQESLKRLLPQ